MKEAKEEAKENNGCCQCIKCLSKCPECGSGDIDVEFKPIFQYDGDIEKSKSLLISCNESSIKMYCRDCDFEFDEEFGEDNYGLFPLKNSISNTLRIFNEYHGKIKDDGTLEIAPYNVTYELVGRTGEENPNN